LSDVSDAVKAAYDTAADQYRWLLKELDKINERFKRLDQKLMELGEE